MNKILRFLICATLLSVGVLIHILCMGKDAEQLSFVPPEFDASAQVGMPVIPEVLSGGTAELGNYKMTLTGVIPLKSKDAYIQFKLKSYFLPSNTICFYYQAKSNSFRCLSRRHLL